MRNYRAWLSTLLVPLIILVIFFFLQGGQGEANHVVRDGRFMLVSMGEYGSFQSFELRTSTDYTSVALARNPNSRIMKMTVVKDPLDKSQLKIDQPAKEISIPGADIHKIIVEGNTLYLINLNEGLTIYNNTDRDIPQRIAEIPFWGIRDLTFYQGLAFVAAGSNGVYVLDLTNPADAKYLAHTGTPCEALSILPASFMITETVSEVVDEKVTESSQTKERFLAYVACGESGIIVMDYLNPSKEPRRVVEVNQINTGGFAYGLTFKGSYLFVANGTAGIHVYDTFGLDPSHPLDLGVMDTPGMARQVLFQNNHLFVADGINGLYIARFTNSPSGAVFSDTHSFPVAGGVSSLDISKDLAFLTSGTRGMHIVEIANPAKPILRSSFETPGMATSAEILTAVIDPQLRGSKIWASIIDIIKKLLFAFLALLVWGFLFVPLTQPIHSSNSLIHSIIQYAVYLVGNSGRAVFVENGQGMSPQASQEITRLRPLILDNASAGLVLDQQGNMRVVGPGMDLLYPHQALVKLTNLHPRNFIFGPADEDPFAPKQEDEDEPMARQRLLRRLETSGTSRDGVEVVPNIIVDFRVKAKPASGASPLGYHPAYALQALRRDFAANKSSINFQPGGELDHLPGKLAAQAWRLYLANFTLAELFAPLQEQTSLLHPNPTFGLEHITALVYQHLTQQYVNEIGEHGQASGQLMLSEAFNELEQAGLEVQRVWIVNLKIAPEHAAEHLRNWQTTWQATVAEEKAALDARYREVQGINRQRGQMDFIRYAFQPLQDGLERYQTLPEYFMNLNRSLHLLVHGTRQMGGFNPADQLRLDAMLDWLERSLD